MYKQIVIARKDLNMNPGKLASQVSHGSMAFLTWMIRNNTKCVLDNYYRAWAYRKGEPVKPQLYRRQDFNKWAEEARNSEQNGFFAEPVDVTDPYGAFQLCAKKYHYDIHLRIDNETFEQWINGEFTKVVLQARNKNQLLKAKTMAEGMGMKEGEDFFLIRDNCHTELEPEEFDENGVGRTLTCIGFRPMDSEVIDQIGKKYQLYV